MARFLRQPVPITRRLPSPPPSIGNVAMYLVEIQAGREQLYQSVEALAADIREGVIGPESRIFHRASSSWISITLHPEYRKAVAASAESSSPQGRRNHWTFFGANPQGREQNEAAKVPSSQPQAGEAAAQSAPAARGIRALLARARAVASSASLARRIES